MHNLIADLRAARFDSHEPYLQSIREQGFSICEQADDRVLAWIDLEFGGTWSSEALASRNIVVMRGEEICAFVSYDARGLRFSWLRAWRDQGDVGVFGPIGVAKQHRGSHLGANLLLAALALLRAAGYGRALIPAVGDEGLVRFYTRNAGASICETFEKGFWKQRRYKTTVLVSGGGTNFQAVADAARDGALPLKIDALISNNPQAYAIERAHALEIPSVTTVLWNRAAQSRAEYDEHLRAAVEYHTPELVLLLGWMHILSARFVSAFPEMINIHPAFLPLDQGRDEVVMPDGSVIPALRGAHAIRDAFTAQLPWYGATCHSVSEATDRGGVLTRRPLKTDACKSEDELLSNLHPIEHQVLLGGIRRWIYERG